MSRVSLLSRFMSSATAQPVMRRGLAEVRDGFQELHHPTNLQKRILVWGRIYKNLAEVPEQVSTYQLKKAKDVVRIKGNLLTCLAGSVGCGLIIYSQHQMRKRHLAGSD